MLDPCSNLLTTDHLQLVQDMACSVTHYLYLPEALNPKKLVQTVVEPVHGPLLRTGTEQPKYEYKPV